MLGGTTDNHSIQELDNRVREHQVSNKRNMDDILDIEVSADDQDLLGEHFDPADHAEHMEISELEVSDEDAFAPKVALTNNELIPEEVFRAYDIRGLADPFLSADFVLRLGKALGSEALEQKARKR